MLRRAVRLAVRDSQADVVVTVHPLATTGLIRCLERLGMRAPVIVVVTDLVTIHPTWAAPRATAVSAPTTQARDTLVRYGVPPERVSVLGLPVDEAFSRDMGDRGELRRKLGLEPDRFTVLLVGGGEGTGGLEKLCAAAAGRARGGQVVVVTGRNEALRQAHVGHELAGAGPGARLCAQHAGADARGRHPGHQGRAGDHL